MENLSLSSNPAVSKLPAGFDINKLLPQQKQRSSKNRAGETEDSVDVNLKDVYKSLTVLGDEVISKLDELLADKVPGGIRSLNPEEHTSEKTAERIAGGALALFPTFARQNPELSGEELLNKFMETIRGGISSGLSDAVNILGSIGAFEFDGIKDGIDNTMQLVEDKLVAFENQFRKDNGLSTDTPNEDQKLSA